jgi:hypothetical protein
MLNHNTPNHDPWHPGEVELTIPEVREFIDTMFSLINIAHSHGLRSIGDNEYPEELRTAFEAQQSSIIEFAADTTRNDIISKRAGGAEPSCLF